MLVGHTKRAYDNQSEYGQLLSVLNLDSKQDDNATSFHEIVHRFEQDGTPIHRFDVQGPNPNQAAFVNYQ
jgi:hypothetical protein